MPWHGPALEASCSIWAQHKPSTDPVQRSSAHSASRWQCGRRGPRCQWQHPAAHGPSTSPAQTLRNAPQHTVPALAASCSVGPAQVKSRPCATLLSARCQRQQQFAAHGPSTGPSQGCPGHARYRGWQHSTPWCHEIGKCRTGSGHKFKSVTVKSSTDAASLCSLASKDHPAHLMINMHGHQ